MPEYAEFRYGELEYREDGPADDDYLGKSIGGTILRYGDEATFPWGKERFEPGAFGDVSKLDLIANRMHQRMQPIARNGANGNLVVKDTPTELSGTVRLLNNSAGRDTDLEVRMGLLRGQSIEFQGEYRPDRRRHPGCQRREPVWPRHCRQTRVPGQQGRHPCGNAILG